MFWIVFSILAIVCIVGLAKILAPAKEVNGGTIDAFFGDDDPNDTSGVQNVQDPYKKNYLSPGKQILIAFGTEYGFSEGVAKKLYDSLSGIPDIQPRMINMANYSSIDFMKEQVVLLICSTAGDGVPPSEARPFLEWISSNPIDFSHINYCVLALGDSGYPHFCRAGITFDEKMSENKAKKIIEKVTVDLEDWSVINNWIEKVNESLKGLDIEIREDYLDAQSIGSKSKGPSRSLPYQSIMIEKRELTQASTTGENDKEVIHCEFDLRGSGLSYTSGDALGIYPVNNPSDVEEIFRIVGPKRANEKDDVILPSSCYGPLPEGNKVNLKEALMKYYDLKKVQPELIKTLFESCNSSDEKEKAKDLISKGFSLKENQVLAKYLEEREVLDVLEDFGSSPLRLTELLKNIRLLQPRYYSISSSPQSSLGTKVSVTAAVVRYQSLSKPRTGVCTTFLCDRLKIGELCPVFISQNPEFRLPTINSTPIIMIGPGTGIAPFRAFLQERCSDSITDQSTTKSDTNHLNLLYFGCRHPEIDYLYREEFEKLSSENKLDLRVAFSRYEKKKVYVQHLIKEDSDKIWNLINQSGAHVYVCGDATHMARDVHETLLSIFQEKGGMDSEQAEKYMSNLEKQKRYQRDVWVT